MYVPSTLSDAGPVYVHVLVPEVHVVALLLVAPACQEAPFQYWPLGSVSVTLICEAFWIPAVASLVVPDHALLYVPARKFVPDAGAVNVGVAGAVLSFVIVKLVVWLLPATSVAVSVCEPA